MATPAKVTEDPALKDMEEMGYYEARAKAERLYHGKPVTEMYYPKGLDPESTFYDRGVLNKTVKLPPRSGEGWGNVHCSICSKPMCPFPRHFKDEPLYCVPCLKERWFYTGPRPDGDTYSPDLTWAACPVEVLARVAGFLSEYRDFCAFSRVSTKCLEACNGDSWYESEMTRIKRYTISKEIQILRDTVFERATTHARDNGLTFADTPAGEFCRRLEVGNFMGEFIESTTTPERKRRLIGLLVGSQYVAHALGLRPPPPEKVDPSVRNLRRPSPSLLPPRYGLQHEDRDGKLKITADTVTCVIWFDERKNRYIADVSNDKLFTGKLHFDGDTALFLIDEGDARRATGGGEGPCKSNRKCIVA